MLHSFLVKRVIGMPGDHHPAAQQNGLPEWHAQNESYVVHKQWMPDGYRDNFPSSRAIRVT